MYLAGVADNRNQLRGNSSNGLPRVRIEYRCRINQRVQILARYPSLHPSPRSAAKFSGGRVGRATAKGLAQSDIDYCIIEKNPERIRDPQRYIAGDAAALEILEKAGIRKCSTVVITSHDDDINVYLSIYFRKLRPDVEILARANQDRNVSTLHCAGADFVMSYASMGSTTIFNMLRRDHLLSLTEGLEAFKVNVPPSTAGKSLAECRLRQTTGCNVVGVEIDGKFSGTPDPRMPPPANANLIMIGDDDGEKRFREATRICLNCGTVRDPARLPPAKIETPTVMAIRAIEVRGVCRSPRCDDSPGLFNTS